MDTIKINDWQEMALKKDTETIIKKLETHEPFFASVCWEIVLAIGVIIIDHLFDTTQISPWIWVLCVVLAIAPPVILLISWFIKWQIRIFKARSGSLNIKQFVDIFDNQICYWVMMSNSYTKMLPDSPIDQPLESIFIFQESCYYINKSIESLYKMKPVIHKVFSTDRERVIHNKIVALYRLVSMLNLMKNNRTQLVNALSAINTEHAVQEQVTINQKYDELMDSFIHDVNILFSVNLSWIA